MDATKCRTIQSNHNFLNVLHVFDILVLILQILLIQCLCFFSSIKASWAEQVEWGDEGKHMGDSSARSPHGTLKPRYSGRACFDHKQNNSLQALVDRIQSTFSMLAFAYFTCIKRHLALFISQDGAQSKINMRMYWAMVFIFFGLRIRRSYFGELNEKRFIFLCSVDILTRQFFANILKHLMLKKRNVKKIEWQPEEEKHLRHRKYIHNAGKRLSW